MSGMVLWGHAAHSIKGIEARNSFNPFFILNLTPSTP
jgi:hypothetical protein